MRQFKIEISAQTEKINYSKKCYNQWKLYSEKSCKKLKVAKPYLRHSILEQVKVAEWGGDYMKQAAKVSRQPLCWNPWKRYISFARKFVMAQIQASLHSSSPFSSVSMLAHFHKILIQVGQPVKGERVLF